MMITESAARGKACRAWGAAVTLHELRGGPHPVILEVDEPKCIGSACMHWRWAHGDPAETTSKGGILLPPEQWSGYCGLAGEPRERPLGEPDIAGAKFAKLEQDIRHVRGEMAMFEEALNSQRDAFTKHLIAMSRLVADAAARKPMRTRRLERPRPKPSGGRAGKP